MQTKFVLLTAFLAVLFLFHFNTVVQSTSIIHSGEKWEDDLSSEDLQLDRRLASAKFASGLGKRLASAKFASGLGKRLASAKFASGLGKRLASAKFASGLGKRNVE